MDLDLSGHVVAVTGASSGIGEATALTCAAAGAAVALGARRTDRIEALAQRIEADGGRAVAIGVDVADRAAAQAFVTGAAERLGGLDALVNNAGLMLLGQVQGADVEEWERMVTVNVLGLMYCTHAALPLLHERGGGTVVNVSSIAGRRATAGAAVYNATKFAVGAFSEGLRQEQAPHDVRIALVEPGGTETELLSHNSDAVQAQAAKRFEGVPKLEAQHIADAILYVLAQPAGVAVNEVLVRPTRQVG